VIAVACGTGYNLYNLANKDPRAMTWVMDERLRGMDLLESSPPEAKAVQPPAHPTHSGPAKSPTPEPSPSSKPKEAPLPQPESAIEKAAESPKDAAPASEFPMIDIAAAHEEYRNETLFIDARRTREYEAGHITGALTASAWEADLLEKITKIREEYPTEAPIVVYCGSSKECEDSKIVSRQLREVGFTSIMIYQGGFPEWSKEKPDLATQGKEPGKREAP
jgi:rhodanese-related sulfurtransferase